MYFVGDWDDQHSAVKGEYSNRDMNPAGSKHIICSEPGEGQLKVPASLVAELEKEKKEAEEVKAAPPPVEPAPEVPPESEEPEPPVEPNNTAVPEEPEVVPEPVVEPEPVPPPEPEPAPQPVVRACSDVFEGCTDCDTEAVSCNACQDGYYRYASGNNYRCAQCISIYNRPAMDKCAECNEYVCTWCENGFHRFLGGCLKCYFEWQCDWFK